MIKRQGGIDILACLVASRVDFRPPGSRADFPSCHPFHSVLQSSTPPLIAKMPVIGGVKMSCDVCHRGHRSAVCQHYDRPLTIVRPKGRPSKKPKSSSSSSSQEISVSAAPPSTAPSASSAPKCCKKPTCQCYHQDDTLIESKGCQCCEPGIAQLPLAEDLPRDDLLASSSSSSSSSGTTKMEEPPFDVSTYTTSASVSSPVGSGAPLLDLSLPCTCPQPCPCPGCPGHTPENESSSSKKRSMTLPGAIPCCSDQPQRATRVSREHCSSCLLCVVSVFEQGKGIQSNKRLKTSDNVDGTSSPDRLADASHQSGRSMQHPIDEARRYPLPHSSVSADPSRSPTGAASPGHLGARHLVNKKSTALDPASVGYSSPRTNAAAAR